MQDPEDNAPEQELSPRQEREITRLLADARHTEPMPEAVATRIEAALAELAAQRGPDAAPVVDLAGRRRTRRLRLLAAAAAVVAAGAVLPSILPGGTDSADMLVSGSDDSGESAESAESAAGGRTALEDRAASESAPSPAAPAPTDQSATKDQQLVTGYRAWVIRIRPEHFAADVELATRAAVPGNGAARSDRPRPLAALPSAVTECLPEDASGTVYRSSYGGRPGVLIVGPPVGGQRRYELIVCGQPEVTRSVLLPAQ